MAEKVRTYRSGLWNGVRTTDEPIDDGSAALLQDAVNGYLPDPVAGSGFYARPGFTADQTLASGARVQAVFSVVLTDGTFYNFTFVDGVLYRSTTVGGALTNVTPTGAAAMQEVASDSRGDGVSGPFGL